MRRYIAPVFISLHMLASAAPDAEKPAEAPPKDKDAPVVKPVEPVTRESSVTIDGKKVPYKVTTGKLQLKDDEGKPRAAIFSVSYVRTDTKDATARPVMFAFNGGPGASSKNCLPLGGFCRTPVARSLAVGTGKLELRGDGVVARAWVLRRTSAEGLTRFLQIA